MPDDIKHARVFCAIVLTCATRRRCARMHRYLIYTKCYLYTWYSFMHVNRLFRSRPNFRECQPSQRCNFFCALTGSDAASSYIYSSRLSPRKHPHRIIAPVRGFSSPPPRVVDFCSSSYNPRRRRYRAAVLLLWRVMWLR